MRKKLFLLPFFLLLAFLSGCNPQQFTPAVNGWTLISTQQLQVADGVNYTELYFRDELDFPHIAYVLTADPKKVTLHKGTSNNDVEQIPTQPQNTLEHMQSSVDDGLNVVAAVNGDFFNIENAYTSFADHPEFQKMPCYPDEGSIRLIDGIIVVKCK